jgi:hypothetical protein
MLGNAWLTLRQAQEALRNGRLDEAHRLLCQSVVHGHKRSWELLQQLGQQFVERGERYLRNDDPEAAWNDLLLAEQVGVASPGAEKLRQELTRQGIAGVRTMLEAGEPKRAAEAIAELRQRSVRQPELKHLEDLATDWVLAEELAGRGEFSQALLTVERQRRLLPGQFGSLERYQKELDQRREVFARHLLQLHEAVSRCRWREVVQLADQVLAVAPQHAEARKAKARAWKAIEPVTVAVKTPEPASPPQPESAAASPQRFLLWIDGVGGYLVCLDGRVTLGQATPEAQVDIPLFADVSRLHATLTRDAEGYLLEAARPLQVNGQPCDKTLLRSGDRITLGASCQLQFMQPVPVSATARLDLVSGHRLALAVDGVILMADTLVLGPGSQVHVSMPDLRNPIVLFRQKDGLGVRFPGKFTIDGQQQQDRGSLTGAAVVCGDDCSFSVEPVVGTRLGQS